MSDYGHDTYECMAKGHEGDREFTDLEAAFWSNKGWNTPLSCKPCRAWYKKQEEVGWIDTICMICGDHWPTPHTFRISYHKRVGNWEEYATSDHGRLCRRCRTEPNRRQIIVNRKAVLRLQLHPIRNQQPATKLPPADKSFLVPGADDLAFYEAIKLTGERSQHGENQLEHILKPGHRWREKLGTKDPRPFVAAVAKLAATTGSDVGLIEQGKRGVIKADLRTGLVVIIRGDKRSSTGNRIETAFFNDDPRSYLARKLKTPNR